MAFTWHWPIAAIICLLVCAAVILLWLVLARHKQQKNNDLPVFSLEADLNTQHASRIFRLWHNWQRVATLLLVISLAVVIAIVARPSVVDKDEERSNSRDIVLCLDVSGSTLPYDREVIETYLNVIKNFQGERIGLSIFNSTSRTVFPLTDDYTLVTKQLTEAADILKGVESQDDIDKMSDNQYQAISDWLDGTQNRKDSTSLIGDGLVSCAAMLPGFAYGNSVSTQQSRHRAASIVLATDNVLSGTPTYTLAQALTLTHQAQITVDGLYSGPRQDLNSADTLAMKDGIERNGGVFLTQSSGAPINELVKSIEQRNKHNNESKQQAALIDAPEWWVLLLTMLFGAWLCIAWRLRR